MPIVQISKIQHRTGNYHVMPQLDVGELGYATDTKQLFIGDERSPGSNIDAVFNTEVLTNSACCVVNFSQVAGTADIQNIKIAGGNNGYVLQTDGTGNLSWAAQTGGSGSGSPAGTDTQIQFNSSGSFDGSTNLTFNKTSNTLTATYFAGNASKLNNIPGANVTGYVPNASHANTVTASSQPNITSVGNLVNLVSNGNVDFSNANVILGDIANVTIEGGTNGYVLQTDGAGNLSWVEQAGAASGTTPGGSDTQVQYNSGGHFAGSSSLTFNATTGTLTTVHIVANGSSLSHLTGSNVVGSVPDADRATISDSANYVAFENVDGLGNIASLNLNGSSSQVLYGNGSFGESPASYTDSNVIALLSSYQGDITANSFIGDGSQLTGISLDIANTVRASSQPNITSVGTLVSVDVTGNVTAGNISATLVTGTLTTAAQPNITSVGTLVSANVNGNITTSGTVKLSNTTDSNTSIHGNAAGALQVSGGAYVAKNLNVGNGIVTGNVLTSNITTNYLSVSGNIEWNMGTKIFTENYLSSIEIYSSGSGWSELNYANKAMAYVDSTGFGIQSNATGTSHYWYFDNAGNTSIPGNVSIHSNVIAANANLGNLVTANYFSGDGSLLTGVLPTRQTITAYTQTIDNNDIANITATGYKGYALYSIQTSVAAWVTVYSSAQARTDDSSRPQTADPAPGSGVIAEVISASSSPYLFTPAIIGFSSETVPDNNIKMKVKNLSGQPANIVVSLTVLKMEN